MLYYLHWLSAQGWPALSVFKAVTFRAAFAGCFAFLLCLAFTPLLIAFLKRRKVRDGDCKKASEFLAQQQQEKKDTPTMGGVVLIGATLLATAFFARPDVLFVPLAFFTMLALALIGFYDDWLKLTDKKHDGMSVRDKLLFQFLVGGGVGAALTFYGDARQATTLAVPFLDIALWPTLGLFYVAWAAVVVAGTSNAVNLTDGLDGLATLCTLTVAVTFGALAYFAGHAGIAEHLAVPRVRGAEELVIVCAALAGACLGFLWYNFKPAEIFMGDTGSLAMGGLVGLVALCIKQELLLVLVGGIFVVEALSVVIQVGSFKLRHGKRVFLVSPLHHHYQKLGWPETKVVARFFIIPVLLSVFSVALLRIH